MTASFDAQYVETALQSRGVTLGAKVTWQAETASTNDDALLALKQAATHGQVFVADTQTRGRGRRGSEWVSSPGEGLWCSLALRPKLAPEHTPLLALAAGLAVRHAVAARVKHRVDVKWPNDVWCGGRKIAGILVESQVQGASTVGVVVGIGVNVTQQSFPPAIAELATSLLLAGATDARREELLVDILQAFEIRIDGLVAVGCTALCEELRASDALRGRRIQVDEVRGVGEGISDSGELLLRTAAGKVVAIASGHVQLLASGPP